MPTTIENDLTALRESAAFAAISDRAFLRITGTDATRWLNGMVTNNITTLAPGEGNYNFLLNAQGRIQGDCVIYREAGDPTTFLLATDAAQLEPIQHHLDHFIIMDDVELTPALLDESTLLLCGPAAPQQLAALDMPSLDPLRLAPVSTAHGPILLVTPSPGLVPAFEIHAGEATLAALRKGLRSAGVPEISPEVLEALRILSGRPRYGMDIGERDLPQETTQTHALHFAKGCYLGQEIVERIHSRGQVHRTFRQFRLDGALPESLPAPLESNSKPAGELTSVTRIGAGLYALGYVRRELIETHAPLTYPGGTATAVSDNLPGNSPLGSGN